MGKQKLKTVNPALVLGVGLLPLIWVTTSLKSALIFSVLVVLAMVLSQMLVGAFRLVIAERVRFICYALCVLAVVYFLDSAASELMPKQYGSFYHLIVLILASSVLFYNLEQTKDLSFGLGLKQALMVGGIYALSLVCLGLLREFLGLGTLFDKRVLDGFDGIAFFSSLPGGLLLLIILTLIYNTFAHVFVKKQRVYDSLVERYEAVLDKNVKLDKVFVPTADEAENNDTDNSLKGGN